MSSYFPQSRQTLEDSLLATLANELDPDSSIHTDYPARRRKLHPEQEKIRKSKAKRKIIRAGRRGGKTVTASDIAVQEFQKGHRILYATPTAEQIDRFWYEVNTALVDGLEAGVYYKNETRHIIEVKGSENRIRAKTAWNSETLRGDYADVLILDEFQLMTESTWNEVGAPMLLDNDGNAIFIYTPPSLRMRGKSRAADPQNAAKMFQKAKQDTTGRWAAFHFSSHDNPYISKDALKEITTDITDLAYRQEILAEDVDEAPGALWTRDTLTKTRLAKVQGGLSRVVVSIDPSATATGDDAGIVGAGMNTIGSRQHFYVLADETVQGSPKVWAQRAVDLFYTLDADYIVAEANNGGEMVSSVIHQVDPKVKVKLVHASRGKATRAEPVSIIFEEGRGHIVGNLYGLEDEMCLAAGTLITTNKGNIPIERIKIGDYVLTRKGYYPVTWSGQTGMTKQLVHIETSNGRYLLTTVSHPIYNRGIGFVQADNLKKGDLLETDTWHTNHLTTTNTVNRLSGTIDDGSLIIAATTWIEKALSYIEKSGKRIAALFRRVTSFITRMKTDLIIAYQTLSVLLSLDMPQFIRGTIGLQNQERNYPTISKSDGLNQRPTKLNASVVELSLKVRECGQCSMTSNVDGDTIKNIAIIRQSKPQPVYNLTVDTMHEYYANGLLVHNCLWIPGDPSPNRMDAMVWAGTELMLQYKLAGAVR